MESERFFVIFLFNDKQFTVKCSRICRYSSAFFSPRSVSDFSNGIIEIYILEHYFIAHFIFKKAFIIFSVFLGFFANKFHTIFKLIGLTLLKFIQKLFRADKSVPLRSHFIKPLFLR